MLTLLHGPGCNLGGWYGMPPSCALLGDLQSAHELCCYDNITRTRNVSEYMLVLALCLVIYSISCGFVVQQAVGLQQNPQKIYTSNRRLHNKSRTDLYNKCTTNRTVVQQVHNIPQNPTACCTTTQN